MELLCVFLHPKLFIWKYQEYRLCLLNSIMKNFYISTLEHSRSRPSRPPQEDARTWYSLMPDR